MSDTADAAKLLPCPLSDAQIKHMVDRFLAWRLPKPWTPDNGISYVRPNYMHAPADHDWPTGTNLFDWSQVEAMVRYMIEGMPGLAARPRVEDAGVEHAVEMLRDDVQAYHEIADLLDRLAGERDELRRALSREQTSGVAREAFDQICQERDGLEAKLAEREAELAKGPEIADKIAANPPTTPRSRDDDWQQGYQDGAMEVAAALREHHSARQQQASAEPTERGRE